MAINRHSAEWKRAVYEAVLGGVTFSRDVMQGRFRGEYTKPRWRAHLPTGMSIVRDSKYEAAVAAKEYLMQDLKVRCEQAQLAVSTEGAELRSSD